MSFENWKEFELGKIFSLKRGKRHIEAHRIKGDIPFYSASMVNNGVAEFVGNPVFTDENKIVVSIFCTAFYAEHQFTASDDVTLLGHKNLNKYNGKFIVTLIKSNESKYTFGRKAFTERLRNQKILLPVTQEDTPDWQAMERYMQQKELLQTLEVLKYYSAN